MAEITVNGIRVHYRESGSGPPVLFLYGGGVSGAQWRALAGRLGRPYRAVTMELHGYPPTDPWPGPPEALTHDAEAALARAILDTLGEPAHVVGHSYGGGVAVRLALADASGVRSLTLLEPQLVGVLDHAGETDHAGAYWDLAHEFCSLAAKDDAEPAWERFVDINNTPGTWARMGKGTRRRLLELTDTIVAGWYACLSNPTTAADGARLRVPTLLVCGGRSAPMFRRMTELLAEGIPGARLQVIPDAGHMAPVTHPDTVAEALAAHLAAH